VQRRGAALTGCQGGNASENHPIALSINAEFVFLPRLPMNRFWQRRLVAPSFDARWRT
jgi:hypothetical protein